MNFSLHPQPESLITTVGHDVWIGRGAYISAGVTIGDGAVVGMGSVVTKDVAPYTIVGGVPARIIRERFSSEVASALVASQWWLLNDEQLKRHSQYFDKPDEYIRKMGNL